MDGRLIHLGYYGNILGKLKARFYFNFFTNLRDNLYEPSHM
jgi:hypothetical protein